MRSATTAFLWLITTVLLAVALPAAWVQLHVIDRSGYSALARQAATDPQLQSAMAAELTAQVGRLSSTADSTAVSPIARLYTAGSAFPAQFGQANAFAHRWLFTGAVGSGVDEQGRWVIDFAPMLSDAAFAQTLRDYGIGVPASVPIPLTDTASPAVRPGALREIGMWWPWATIAAGALAAVAALLMLTAAPSRGKGVAALGVSALLVGGLGWAAMELGQSYLNRALNGTSGSVRTVADAMVSTARDSMHQWLNVTLISGGGLVVVGVIVALLTGLSRPVSGR